MDDPDPEQHRQMAYLRAKVWTMTLFAALLAVWIVGIIRRVLG